MNILELYNNSKLNFTELEIKIYIAEAIRKNDVNRLKVSRLLEKFNISNEKLIRILNKLNRHYDEGNIIQNNNVLVLNINSSYNLSFTNHSEFSQLWDEFMDIRKKKKASQTDRAIKGLLKRLTEYSNGNDEIAIKILEKSCDMGWKDVFPLPITESKNIIDKNITAFGNRSWNQ